MNAVDQSGQRDHWLTGVKHVIIYLAICAALGYPVLVRRCCICSVVHATVSVAEVYV